MVLDGTRSDSIPVRWDQVIAIREVWTSKTLLTGSRHGPC
jgi:hypothetical protein